MGDRHAGTATGVGALPATDPRQAAFDELCRARGISADLQAGDGLVTSGDGVPPLAGTLQAVKRTAKVSAYFLLLDGPAPGTAFLAVEGDGEEVSVCAYLYLYGGDVASIGSEWTAFLAERFPMPQLREPEARYQRSRDPLRSRTSCVSRQAIAEGESQADVGGDVGDGGG